MSTFLSSHSLRTFLLSSQRCTLACSRIILPYFQTIPKHDFSQLHSIPLQRYMHQNSLIPSPLGHTTVHFCGFRFFAIFFNLCIKHHLYFEYGLIHPLRREIRLSEYMNLLIHSCSKLTLVSCWIFFNTGVHACKVFFFKPGLPILDGFELWLICYNK
jgi:hypothetical protein